MEPDMHFDVEQHMDRVESLSLYFALLLYNMDCDPSSDEYEPLDSLQYILWLRAHDGFLREDISSAYRSLFYDTYRSLFHDIYD